MRKISIIATDYSSQDLHEVISKLNTLFYRQYHYELIVYEKDQNLESLKNITNLKILRETKKQTLNQQITSAFAVSDGACTILADFKVLDCYRYIQNLLQLWQNGANVVLSKYKDLDKKVSNKISTGAYNFVANIFGMYETNNCNNTFQLFSKCVADVIKKSPEQNAYLRNTKAWQDYKVMIVTTNKYVEVKESKQKFTAGEKFWSLVSLLGILMFASFIGFGYKMFKIFEASSVIGTSYLFVALTSLIIGIPSLIVSRTKNKFGNSYKKDAYEALFDANVRRLFDLDLYDERDAGLKSIKFDASMIKNVSDQGSKTYNHGYEKYVPQFLKDGSIAPKRKMEYVGSQRGPVLYSYLSTAQAVANNQVSVVVKAPTTEKIKTSKKANELNDTIKRLTKDDKKVVLKQKTVKNNSVKEGKIISTSSPKKAATKTAAKTVKTTTTPQIAKTTVAKKVETVTTTSKKAATLKSAQTKAAPKKVATTTKSKNSTKSSASKDVNVTDLKKQLEEKLNAAIQNIRAENSAKKKK